jgi:hypothetical protein
MNKFNKVPRLINARAPMAPMVIERVTSAALFALTLLSLVYDVPLEVLGPIRVVLRLARSVARKRLGKQ